MVTHDQWITRYLRRLSLGQVLKLSADWLAGYLLLFGCAVLVVKLLLPQFWPEVLWLAVGVVPVSLYCWWQANRHTFTRAESVALLDKKLNAGGLLMTLFETGGYGTGAAQNVATSTEGSASASQQPDQQQWQSQLPQQEEQWRDSLPKVRPVRFAKLLALPLIFSVSVGFVPLREIKPPTVISNTVGRQAAEELEKMLDKLEAAKVVEKEEAQKLREEINRLKEDAKKNPLTHEKWEIVDALREKLRTRLDAAQLTVNKALAATLTMQKKNAGQIPQMNTEQAEQLKKDMLQALRKFGKDNDMVSKLEKVQELIERLRKEGKLDGLNPGELDLPMDAAQREQLLAELEEFLQKESLELAELRQLCEGQLGQCPGGQCPGGPGGKNSGFAQLQALIQAQTQGNSPGRGGISRGRGDADLGLWNDTDEKGSKFKEVILPPGFKDQPTDEVKGISATTPEVEEGGSSVRNSARNTGPSSGRESWNRKLRPSHRKAVREYFNTGNSSKEK